MEVIKVDKVYNGEIKVGVEVVGIREEKGNGKKKGTGKNRKWEEKGNGKKNKWKFLITS